MSAILPFVKIDSGSLLARYFTPYQIAWIEAEDPFHQAKKQVFALAEKSVRIGWTFCDGFKNVRKRLRFKNRDYLFATKDLPSALEYMNDIYSFADMLGYTRAVLSHGEDFIKVKSLDPDGNPTALTEEIKIGYIKFQNGSRIIAFSSNPYAMAVYGGDVGLDEFAKHPNATLLWQTAQGRVTWGCDLAVWSSHDGEDTLFNQFAQQARSTLSSPDTLSPTSSKTKPARNSSREPANKLPTLMAGSSSCEAANQLSTLNSQLSTSSSPWNLYFRVTMQDAIQLGIVGVINRTKGTAITPEEFLSGCRARAGSDEIFQQSYMCNPMGSATANIVEWSAIELCRTDYQIERLHLESDQIQDRFGQFNPHRKQTRESEIQNFLRASFPSLFNHPSAKTKNQNANLKIPSTSNPKFRLGFDVAASGQGDLAAIYIDQANGSELWLRALFTCRTEDWHFLKTVLFHFLKKLPNLQGAGDESGLGRQICWEAASQFSGRFTKINFATLKHDLGFALMNQLSVAQKRFPRCHQDIAADFFALRKLHTGSRWIFTEGRNTLNPASHCDIAWAGALSSHIHATRKASVGGGVALENCWFDGRDYHPYRDAKTAIDPQTGLLWSDDPRIWRPLA